MRSRIHLSTLPALFIALLLLSTTGASAQPQSSEPLSLQCVFEWEIKARGIVAGTMHDTVNRAPPSSRVVSIFTPSTLAAILGAPTVKRTWTNTGAISERQETKLKSRGATEKNHWIAKGAQLWTVDDNNARQEHEVPEGLGAGARYIDSTVFPYLDLVGPRFSEGTSSAWVLSHSEPYPAQVTRSKDTLQYKAKNKHGTIWITDGKPVRMQFSEKGDTFNAQVVSSNCT